MGYFRDELGKVKGASLAQFEQDQHSLDRAAEDLNSSRDLLRQLESAELFGGQTDGSIAEVARGLGAHLEELGEAARKVVQVDAQAQGAIQQAQSNYDGLPSTNPNAFEYFAATNPVVQVGNYIMTGQDFLSSVTAAREAERERQAKEALDALRASLDQHREALSEITVRPIEFAFVDENSDGVSGPVSPGDPIAPVPPRGSTPPGDGMSPGAPVPPGGTPPGGPVGSGPGPVGSVPPGGLQDADGDGVPVPDLAPGIPPAEEWPFRVYRPGDVSRDGPVDGGYSVPLNPRDGVLPRDPVWREMFEEHQRQAQARAGSGLGGLATAAGVAGLAAAGGRAGLGAAGAGARGVNLPGGVAGAGGLGPGARGVGVGGSAAGGLGSGAGGRGVGVGSAAGLPGGAGAGAGVGARGVGVGAGGVTPDGAGRAGSGGAAGLRGAGAGGVGSGLGSGAAGAGSAAGGARGMGGVPMGGAAGGAGGSQEKDKGRRRRKYGKSGVEFFSLSDPIDPGAAAGEGDAAGARLIEAPQREEGDRW